MCSFKRAFRRLTGNQGFSVVEILIAMLIILIMAAAITPVVVFTTRTSQHSRLRATAKNIANEKIEEIRAMQFADLEVGSETYSFIADDGREYTIDIYVNWEDEAGCMSASHAVWDVKSARVIVSTDANLRGDSEAIQEEIRVLISRDSEQPMFTGANLRLCVFRGWDYAVSMVDAEGNPVPSEDRDYVPVEFVNVQVGGPEYLSLSTTAKGAALFLGLQKGNYEVTVNPGLNMITFPGSYPKNDIPVSDGTTNQLFAFVEEPGSLVLTLKDIDDEPIMIDEVGFEGNFKLEQPYGGDISGENGEPGLIIEGLFTGSDESGKTIPAELFTELWPFPDIYANAYFFKDVNIPGYIMHLKGVWDTEHDEVWKGYFDQPNQTKDLTVYLWQVPEILPPFGGDNWLIAQSGNINHNLHPEPGVANEDNVLIPAIVNREYQHNSLALVANQEAALVATHVLFRGDQLTVNNNASLNLHANIIGFENKVIVDGTGDNAGNIVLYTLLEEYQYEEDGTTVLVNVENAPETITGNNIGVPRGFSGDIEPPWNSKEYGIVYFEDDVEIEGEFEIFSGAYYFPDGFSFADDWDKTPEEGGLIRFTE